jgi:hypothetical protein
MQLRPMTIAEMVPGYTYEPGLSVLEVATLPVFGASGNQGRLWRLPVKMPKEYRESTIFNALLAMEILRLTDPEAAKILDAMIVLSRDPRSRAAAALHPLFDDQHPEKRRPNRRKAARPAKAI